MMFRMPRTPSWFVWGAVVVAGSILSFEIWKRALEPTPNAVARASQIVELSADRTVPASDALTSTGTGSERGSSPGRGGGLFGGSVISLAPGASGGAANLLPGAGAGGRRRGTSGVSRQAIRHT